MNQLLRSLRGIRATGVGRALVLGLAVLIASSNVAAAPSPVPFDQQALSMLRVLTYDRSLKKRAGDAVSVLVVYKQGNAASEAAHAEFSSAIRNLARTTLVSSLPIRMAAIPYTDAKTLEEKAREHKASVLYICAGLDDALSGILDVTRKLSLRSFAGSQSEVRSGAAVGFVLESGKVRYFVNLNASRAEGADLDSNFLRLAEIVG